MDRLHSVGLLFGLLLPFLNPIASANETSPAGLCRELFQNAPNPATARVERTVDGDTARVIYRGQSIAVRFLSVDTLETHFQGQSQGAWGERAADFLRDTLPEGSTVTLEFEGQRCDRYGRVLAYVNHDGRQINRLILQNALAVNYCIVPNTRYCMEYADIVSEESHADHGIFQGRGLVVPYIWRKRIAGIPFDKYVGNIRTMLVYPPSQMQRVPIADRIFFMRRSDVHSPFHFSTVEE